MDIHKIYQPFFRFFRKKRIRLFLDQFEIGRKTRVLDLGGNRFFWDLMISEGYEPPTVIVMNLESHNDELPEYMKWVNADGRKLPFKDNAFDLVFCNSVIEHVGFGRIRRCSPWKFEELHYTILYKHLIEPSRLNLI